MLNLLLYNLLIHLSSSDQQCTLVSMVAGSRACCSRISRVYGNVLGPFEIQKKNTSLSQRWNVFYSLQTLALYHIPLQYQLEAPHVCLNMHTRMWRETSIARGKGTFVYLKRVWIFSRENQWRAAGVDGRRRSEGGEDGEKGELCLKIW